jgi:hypothetical protein
MKWIAQLLDAGEVSPDEVLACYYGAQPDAPVEGLAKLLVPRGTTTPAVTTPAATRHG